MPKNKNDLSKVEYSLYQLSKNIDDVFWLEENGKIIYVNSALKEIWGIDPRTVYSDDFNFLDTIFYEDRSKLKQY